MKNKIIKIFALFFSIFFIIILYNTVFINKTISISYSVPIMILGSIFLYCIIFSMYYVYCKNKPKFLEYKPKVSEIFVFLFIIFILQYIFAKLTYADHGWDCGMVIGNALALLKGTNFDATYFSGFTNNIGLLLVEKYLFTFVNLFNLIENIYEAFFVSIIFNIIMVDIAFLFTFLTIKKILGIKSAYLSFLFTFPFIIFSPYIIIPYTDTMTMLFPILIFYLYLLIKDLPKESFKKYILILLEGLLLFLGCTLKPTVIIIIIAISIIEILSMKLKLKKFLFILITFCIGVGLSYEGFAYLKEKDLGKYISQKEFYKERIPFTMFLMTGMQERKSESKKLYGAYYGVDTSNTRKIKGIKAKEKYNFKIIRKRLGKFGVFGYINFLYNKANWILSDGTFFYGYEGHWRTSEYLNQSKVAKIVQKFIDTDEKTYKNITANVMQILWILITFGLIFSFRRKENSYITISKLTIIGIIMFILLFEGRARYLVNYIPIFILVGTYGIINSFKKIKNLLVYFLNTRH